MKRYYPEVDQWCLPSYEYPYTSKMTGDLYELQWVINVASPEGSSTTESFLTLRAISIIGSEVMCGRAGVVWEVVKLSEHRDPYKVLSFLLAYFTVLNFMVTDYICHKARLAAF